MCLVSSPSAPPPPAPPPPPPPVLEQTAPQTAVDNSTGAQQKQSAQGSKKYRTNLGISDSTSGSNTGLAIT